jgi:N-acetylglucosaminyldiphosphoundecaprenol N-acetyl-beta-D-mannosaminyltransferase
MPVVWAIRSFRHPKQTRVYGPDLMLTLCQRAAECGQRVFLYGARQDTLEALENNLRSRFPQIEIVGKISPPFRPLTAEEDKQVVKTIRESGADLVFVGLSTPKQEVWMINHRLSLPGTIMIGVGAAFDFHAGKLEQAPAWMQRSGLEWWFRLTREPKRLWKRYLLVTPIFLPLWALQKARVLRYK